MQSSIPETGVVPLTQSIGGDSTWQNRLVEKGEIWMFSQAGKIVRQG